jgi:hypothetical protein
MMKEEPSLEMLWLKNIRMMNKFQITVRSNTAPSSKTFIDESWAYCFEKGYATCLRTCSMALHVLGKLK